MKFALNAAGSDWLLTKVSALAQTLGYDGVECNISRTLPSDLSTIGLPVSCISAQGAGEAFASDERDSQHIRSLVDFANQSGCALVKIIERPFAARDRAASAMKLADWLSPLADYAADRSVGLLLDVSQSLRTAREIWTILDKVNHPSLNCSLDLLASARRGESPLVVVPMLNSRIGYVQVSDVKDLSQPGADCDLGEGVVPVKAAIARLRGIGYAGWVTVPWPTLSVEERLGRDITALRDWNKSSTRVRTKAKAK
jgi:sugar phosphate isomerase/epimerase